MFDSKVLEDLLEGSSSSGKCSSSAMDAEQVRQKHYYSLMCLDIVGETTGYCIWILGSLKL